MVTYGQLSKSEIERFVSSPMFPAWCERQERIMQERLAELQRISDLAIQDILTPRERKER